MNALAVSRSRVLMPVVALTFRLVRAAPIKARATLDRLSPLALAMRSICLTHPTGSRSESAGACPVAGLPRLSARFPMGIFVDKYSGRVQELCRRAIPSASNFYSEPRVSWVGEVKPIRKEVRGWPPGCRVHLKVSINGMIVMAIGLKPDGS